jgi:hypothetical protein
MEHSQSIAEDLSTAVARLSLENGEKREGKQSVSYTTTPNNTPFGKSCNITLQTSFFTILYLKSTSWKIKL